MKKSILLLLTLINCSPVLATGLGAASIEKSNLTSSWQEIELGGETLCSDGSEYAIYHQQGKSNNLHIFFQPGGACWDNDSCQLAIDWIDPSNSHAEGIYYSNALNMNESVFQTGIFRQDTANNPLKNWSKVIITYCSGDVHIGDTERVYKDTDGVEKTIYHRGQKNTAAALAWIKQNHKSPDKVFVSGESAGGHGAIYYLPHIVNKFPKAKVYQLSDGNALTTERFKEITEWWGVNSEKNFGFATSNNTMNDAYLHAIELFKDNPNVVLMQQNTLRDRAMVGFQAQTSRVPMSDAIKARWQQDMLYATQELKQANPNGYFYWISDCQMDKNTKLTPHCLQWNDIFYQCKQDGMNFNHWLKLMIEDRHRVDIGSHFLPAPLK